MKFGRLLEERRLEKYQRYYICYKDLKKAIKMFTGVDRTTKSVQDVVASFGNVPALGGKIFRPPEAHFQELLQQELKKINGMVQLETERLHDELRSLKDKSWKIEERDERLKEIQESITQLEEFVTLNSTGFRKITKKYDKLSQTTSSPWFMSMIDKQVFTTVAWDKLVAELSEAVGFVPRRTSHSGTDDEWCEQHFLVDVSDALKVKTMIALELPLVSLGTSVEEIYYDFEDLRGYKTTLTGTSSDDSFLLQCENDNHTVFCRGKQWSIGASEAPQVTGLIPHLGNKPVAERVRIAFKRTEWSKESLLVRFDTNISFSTDGNTEPFSWYHLSIRSQGSIPSFLREVLGRATIRKIDGFSKHLHAVAAMIDGVGFPTWYRDLVLEEVEVPLLPKRSSKNTQQYVTIQERGTAGRFKHEMYMHSQVPTETEGEIEAYKISDETSIRFPTPASGGIRNDLRDSLLTPQEMPPISPKNQRIAIVRVEPKTHFANERTLLDWIHCIVLVCVAGIAMMKSSDKILFAGGFALVPVNMALMFYSMVIYHNRRNLLRRKEITDYASKLPLFFTVILVVQVLLSLILTPSSVD